MPRPRASGLAAEIVLRISLPGGRPMIPRGMSWPAAAAAIVMAVVFTVLAWRNFTQDPEPAPTVVTEISLEEYRARERQHLAELQLVTAQRDGLRGALDLAHAKLRGLQALAPDTIFQVDAQPMFIDTAIAMGSFDIRRGLELFVGVDRDSVGAYRMEIVKTSTAAGCERVTFRGTQAVCMRPPFGHAEIFVRAGVSSLPPTTLEVPKSVAPVGELGIRWVPSLVSPWAVESSIDIHRRLEISLERSLEIW